MAQATEGIVGSGGLGLSNSGKGMMALKRVISVILDDSHEHFSGFQSLGTIFYEDPYDSFNSLEGELKVNINNSARPITPNQQFYPLIGELVFLINTMSNEPSGGDKQFNYRNYYFPPIRVHNQSSQNSQPAKFTTEEITQTEKKDRAQSGTPNKASESSGAIINLGDFFEDRGVKRLLPYEGDYIIEGRFGNSIRFGATTPYNEETETPYPNPWSFNSVGGKSTPNETEAQIGDPITIIRNGQTEVVSDNALVPLLEDINGDHSSIYLCSNQRLENFKVAGASTASPDTVKQEAYIIKEEDTIDNPLTTTTYKLTAGIFDTSETAVTPTSFSLAPTSTPTQSVTPSPPTATITVTSSIQDATDDGLSFFDEMVDSGAVEADNFIVEEFLYENTSVSGTELSPETIVDNLPSSENPGNPSSTPSQTKYTTYPARIPSRKHPGKFAGATGYINPPQPYASIAYNIKTHQDSDTFDSGKYKKSSRVTYLCIHTSAGGYGQTHLDVASIFMQTKGWGRLGYATTIDKEGMCCRHHGDGDFTNGINSHGRAHKNGKFVYQGIDVPNFNYATGVGKGINNNNVVNISWLGGANIDVLTDGGDAMTREQAAALKAIIKAYCDVYPNLKVIGHNQCHKKSCPRFYVPTYMKLLGGKYTNMGFEFPGQNPGAKSRILLANAGSVNDITGLQSGV